jgi:guanylate kinase
MRIEMSSNEHRRRIVVLSAPSGSGKTTIAHRLLERIPQLRFSVSATTRQPRGHERHGADYYFMTTETFHQKIAAGAFVEWEEVYPGIFYGTLEEEIERINRDGVPLLDIDVKGALNVKRHFGDAALTIFVQPPSLAVLAERLQGRGTETEESLAERLERARLEMSYATEFDAIVINDELERAIDETVDAILQFLAVGTASTVAQRAR